MSLRKRGPVPRRLPAPDRFDAERYFRDAPLMIVGAGVDEIRHREEGRVPEARGDRP
ncbi:MAG TPA: hypothetical protein VG226_02320 [Acidimicrobiales bacterium]|nr:hypothetical protein [Acidimicrobiales bacterium]